MTGFDYPPSRDYELGAALEQVQKQHTEAVDRVTDLTADDDADDAALQQARREKAETGNYVAALEWAVDQFDNDAALTLSAFTARQRGRIQDTLRNQVMGDLGEEESSVWFVAAAIDDAPWVDPGDDLTEVAHATGQLPPALVDWLSSELEELNDLTAGN